MSEPTLGDLQESLADKSGLASLEDYQMLGEAFLSFLEANRPVRIISPSHSNYIFYQYSSDFHNKITRPLNLDLFLESRTEFHNAFERFICFLDELRKYEEKILSQKGSARYLASNEMQKVVYTMQQAIGSIGDSFENENQSRKRIGQSFERLVKLVIQQLGADCEPRTIQLPIPGDSGQQMPYELDFVFSRNKAIVASETKFIHESEIVGSVKTTSKDRIDKIFLDKYLLTKFLGRDIPVVAIFLHDVQRARRGKSIFGISSTFKRNHFLVYSVALNKLDGVYYVDPRPEMVSSKTLRDQIHTFQDFLVKDFWILTGKK